MYIPKHFAETDRRAMHDLIAAHPFATWVTHTGGQLVVNHIPLLLHAGRGELGTLVGHVARANPIWRHLQPDSPSVAIFQGAHSYITPSWYPSKHATGKAVPTWNYLVVHAHGVMRTVDDREWLRAHVVELTHRHEHQRPAPWTVDDAPADYIETLLGAIVGVEMTIESLEGKRKLSQNRSEPDLAGIVTGLSDSEEADPEMIRLAAEAVRVKQTQS